MCVPGFFHSTICLWHLSMLLNVVEVHLFSSLDSILMDEHTILFIHSTINGYLGSFLFGAIMISAARVSFLYMIFM